MSDNPLAATQSQLAGRVARMTTLAQRVILRRKQLGLTQQQLADAVGKRVGTIQFIENGTTKSPGFLQKLADALGTSVRWLVDGVDEPGESRQTSVGAGNEVVGSAQKSDGRAFEDASHMSADVSNLSLDLPVYEVVPSIERTGMFTVSGEVVDMLRRPPGLAYAKKAYCINILTNAMEPALRQGSAYPVNPAQPPRAGDDVIIEFRSGPDAGQQTIKRIVGWERDHLIVCQFNPPQEDRYPVETVTLLRIVPWPEVMRG